MVDPFPFAKVATINYTYIMYVHILLDIHKSFSYPIFLLIFKITCMHNACKSIWGYSISLCELTHFLVHFEKKEEKKGKQSIPLALAHVLFYFGYITTVIQSGEVVVNST